MRGLAVTADITDLIARLRKQVMRPPSQPPLVARVRSGRDRNQLAALPCRPYLAAIPAAPVRIRRLRIG